MLFVERDLNILLRATIKDNDWLTLFIDVFPSINIVERVVCWKLKPLDLVWVLTQLLHNSIFGWLILVKLENEASFFHGLVRFELHSKVRHNDVVVCDREVMNHSHASDFDIHLVDHPSVLVK